MAQSGVYCIVNLVNDKYYIGSSVNIERRRSSHLYLLRNGKHSNVHLQRAWNQDGESAFEFRIMVDGLERDELVDAEQGWMDLLKPDYNICLTAGSPQQPFISDETREKLRTWLGRRHSEETKIKIRAQRHSPEAKARISESRRGNQDWLGRKHADESKEKIREALQGRKHTTEHVANQIASRRAKRGGAYNG